MGLPLLLYLCGSIPFGLLFAHLLSKTDVRTIGSGNIGATNVLRTGNKTAALLTLLFDFLKGFLPLVLIFHVYPPKDIEPTFLMVLPVIGHMFPCWLKFKGGKGVATGLGVIFAFSWHVGLMMVILWAVAAFFFRIASIAALLAFLISPLLALLFKEGQGSLSLLMLTALVFWAHRDNIKRLLAGEETKFERSTVKKK